MYGHRVIDIVTMLFCGIDVWSSSHTYYIVVRDIVTMIFCYYYKCMVIESLMLPSYYIFVVLLYCLGKKFYKNTQEQIPGSATTLDQVSSGNPPRRDQQM